MTPFDWMLLSGGLSGLALIAVVIGGSLKERDEDQAAPESQDDFTASVLRWGHLRDDRGQE